MSVLGSNGRRSCLLGLLLGLVVLACEQVDPPAGPPPTTVTRTQVGSSPRHPGDLWISVPGEPGDLALQEAIAEARRTSPSARRRWQRASAGERDQWLLKWAADTVEGGVEHVWLVPVRWSAFRIEGILISEPRGELLCGRGPGELVSLPVETLSDWVHLPPDAPREGGFTISVLKQRSDAARGG